jgi:hypothetical protein
LRFLRERTDNTSATTVSCTIGPGQVLALDDVIWTVFGETAKGVLHIWSDFVFIATARTYTGQAGTYGQAIKGQDCVQYGGTTAFTTGLRNAGNYRSNLGVVNWSTVPLDVVAEVYDSSGNLLGTRTFSLPSYGTEQVSVSSFAGQFAAGYIKWRCTTTDPNAAWIVYAAVADNITNDAVFLDERLDDFHTDRSPAYDLTGTWSGIFSAWYGPDSITAVVTEDEALVKVWVCEAATDAYVAYIEGYGDNDTITFNGWSRLYSYWNDDMWGTATVSAGGASVMGTFQGHGFYTGGGTFILNKVSSSAQATPGVPAEATPGGVLRGRAGRNGRQPATAPAPFGAAAPIAAQELADVVVPRLRAA